MSQEEEKQIIEELKELRLHLGRHVEEETELFKKLLSNSGSNNMEKYTKLIQVSLYALAMIVGIGVSWGVMSTKLAAAETATQRVELLESRVHDMEIKQATEAEMLRSIKADITEIKDDLKKLTKSQ